MIKRVEINGYSYGGPKGLIVFPMKAYEAILMDDRIIVGHSYDELQEKFPNLPDECAVFCYDLEGNVLWQVDYPYYIDRNTGEKVICDKGQDAIQGIGYNREKNMLIARGTMGYECDPETGKLGAIVWQER